MKYEQLNSETKQLLNWNFDKFIEHTFDYGELDYESLIEFLQKKIEYYQDCIEEDED